MRSSGGFTLLELMVVMGLIGVLAAIAIPSLMGSANRTAVWTTSEQIGSQIRQARLKAISRNTRFRVRFDCPQVGQFRVLRVTGDPTFDNAADRCDDTLDHDSGVYQMPANITVGDDPPLLEVNGRGVFTSDAGLPTVITISHIAGGVTVSRTLTMSATGQITFGD